MSLPSKVSFVSSLTSERRATFYAQHKTVSVVMIVLVFVLPFIGLFFGGLVGVVLAVLISILAYYLTPYAVSKLYGGNKLRAG